MKYQKEIYREFNKSLLIYMAGDIPTPNIDYGKLKTELKVDTLASLDGVKEPLDGTRFAQKKDKAQELLNKIDHDANPDAKTQSEKNLEEALKGHNEKQFRLLEHNYNLAKDKLGENWKKETSPMKKAEVILEASTDNFIKALENHILKENINKGNLDAKGQIIEQILRSKGIDLKGIGKYIIKGMGESSFNTLLSGADTRETRFKKLEEKLSGEDGKQILKDAMMHMENDLPKIEYKKEKSDYFHSLFEKTKKDGDNKLTKVFGTTDTVKNYAAGVLAQRFHIEWTKKGGNSDFSKPEYLVDVTTNKVYKPHPDSELMGKLRNICHNELGDTDDMAKQESALGKLKTKREAKFNELRFGKNGIASWFDNQIKSLKDLKKNPLLTEALSMTVSYQEQTNRELADGIGRIQKITTDAKDKPTRESLAQLTSSLTPETARKAGLIESIVGLIEMIQKALGKGKDAPKALDDIYKDIKDGINPVEAKNQATKLHSDILNNPKNPPTLEQLLDPKKTAEFFTEAAKDIKEPKDAEKLVSRYPEKGNNAVMDHIKKNLGAEELKIKPTEKGFDLTIKKNGEIVKFYELSKDRDGSFKIKQKDDDVTKALKLAKNDLASIKAAMVELNKPAPVVAAEVREAPKTPIDLAGQVLMGMLDTDYNKESRLGKLMKGLKLSGKFDKTVTDKPWRKKDADNKQNLLDTARVNFLVAKLGNGELNIKKLIKLSPNEFGKNYEKAVKANSAPEKTKPKQPNKNETRIGFQEAVLQNLQTRIQELRDNFNNKDPFEQIGHFQRLSLMLSNKDKDSNAIIYEEMGRVILKDAIANGRNLKEKYTVDMKITGEKPYKVTIKPSGNKVILEFLGNKFTYDPKNPDTKATK